MLECLEFISPLREASIIANQLDLHPPVSRAAAHHSLRFPTEVSTTICSEIIYGSTIDISLHFNIMVTLWLKGNTNLHELNPGLSPEGYQHCSYRAYAFRLPDLHASFNLVQTSFQSVWEMTPWSRIWSIYVHLWVIYVQWPLQHRCSSLR